MKKLIALALSALLLFTFAGSASAATRVHGYTKKNGTYVAPHYRSDRDSSFYNNWSTKGNVNPYTGKKGYKRHR
jgi:opacity protein-like surface antigen